MNYLLDSDICIFLLRNSSLIARRRFDRQAAGSVGISSITRCELEFGASNSANPERNHQAVRIFLSPLSIEDFPADAAEKYAEIRLHLQNAGTPIGNYDMLIAAHALSRNYVLVSNNTKEFSRIPGLRVENWTKS